MWRHRKAGFILAKLKEHLQTYMGMKVRSSTEHLLWGVILIIPLLEEKQCYISLSVEQTYYQQLLPSFCCGLSIQKREVIYPFEKRSFPEPCCFMWMTDISSFLCHENKQQADTWIKFYFFPGGPMSRSALFYFSYTDMPIMFVPNSAL